MKYPSKENDELDDQHVWSAIRYLDPERENQNADRHALGPLIAFVTFWIIFAAAMYLLAVRVSQGEIHPAISTVKTMSAGQLKNWLPAPPVGKLRTGSSCLLLTKTDEGFDRNRR
jgi:hypothetical protein